MAAVISRQQRTIERRFQDLFRRDVAPRLKGLEDERQTHQKRFLAALGLMGAGIIGATVVLGAIDFSWAVLAAFVALAIGFVALHHIRQKYHKAVRAAVMPAVCEAIGDIAHTSGDAPGLDLDTVAGLGVVPRYDRRSIDDAFFGRHRDIGFTMAEVRLRRRGGGRRRRSRTVFKGLVFGIETPHEIPARILIARDSGFLGNRLKGWVKSFSGMQRVPLPHEAFESAFEVYGDQPEVARETVSPAFCDNLVALSEAHAGAPLQGAFSDRRFYLALKRRGNQFRLGSLFRATDDLQEEAARVMHDIQMVHRLIDFLHGDRPQSL